MCTYYEFAQPTSVFLSLVDEDSTRKVKCFDLRCFRAVFLDNHYEAVNKQETCARRFFLVGTIVFSLGLVGFAMYLLAVAGRCYGECTFHDWIPSYLLMASLAEIAHTPANFYWFFDRRPDYLTFTKFDIYRLVSWTALISTSVFGSIIILPHVTSLKDLWRHQRSDQCPCFYWSFWWLAGTWFSLLFTFFFNWMMYLITPCMNHMIEERERRYYDHYWVLYNEERRRSKTNEVRRSKKEPPSPNVPEESPLRKPANKFIS